MENMFAISSSQLDDLPPIGKTEECPRCGKRHMVKYADYPGLGFISCDRIGTPTIYLVAINGKQLKGV